MSAVKIKEMIKKAQSECVSCSQEAFEAWKASGKTGIKEAWDDINEAATAVDEIGVILALRNLKWIHQEADYFYQQSKKQQSEPQPHEEPQSNQTEQEAQQVQAKPAGLNQFLQQMSTTPKPKPLAKWLWAGLIRTGLPALLAGYGEAGKGMLVTALGLSVADGTMYLNRPTDKGPVLIISAEDDLDELNSRAHDIADALGIKESAFDNMYFFSTVDAGISPALLNIKMQPTRLLVFIKQLIEEIQPKLIILDTLAAMAPAGTKMTDSTSSTQYITNVMAGLRTDKCEAPAVLFTSHLRKPERGAESRPIIDDVRDSSAIVGSMRSVMILHRDALSLDKCNGRRRVDPQYFTSQDTIFDLYWQTGTGLNGALDLAQMTTRQALAEISAEEAKEKLEVIRKKRDEEKAAIKKANAIFSPTPKTKPTGWADTAKAKTKGGDRYAFPD